MIPSLERRRAMEAITSVKAHLTSHQTETRFWKAYAKVANGLPIAIRQQGVARALQTEVARAGKQQNEKAQGAWAILEDICKVLLKWYEVANKPAEFKNLFEADTEKAVTETALNIHKLIEQAIALDFCAYTVLQREVIEIVSWLKILSIPHRPKDSEAPDTDDETPEGSVSSDAANDANSAAIEEKSL